MPPAREVRVELGPLNTGLWCDTCQSHGQVSVNTYRWTSAGPVLIATHTGCITCHDLATRPVRPDPEQPA